MRTDPWSDDPCPIARAMAVIGQRWSMLIIREAFLGRTRFSEFKKQLGIASDILSARLAELVSAGVLETVEYREPGDRARSCYELTQSGRDLVVVLGAIGQWATSTQTEAKARPIISSTLMGSRSSQVSGAATVPSRAAPMSAWSASPIQTHSDDTRIYLPAGRP